MSIRAVAHPPDGDGGAAALAPAGQAERVEQRWLLWPPLAFFALTLGLPLLALVQQSTARGGNTFATALTMSVFIDSVWRTLTLAAIASIATVCLAAVYSLAIAVGPMWVKVILMGGLLLSLWTSVMVRTIGWMLIEIPQGALYWLLDKLHLRSEPLDIYQTTIAMYPAMFGILLPFAVLPIVTAVTSIDSDQLKAASSFGAGPMLTLRVVILPAIRQALISGGVLVFVLSLGFYVTPLLLGGPSNMTLSGVINSQLESADRADLGAAMSLLLIGGTVSIYLVADRLFKVSERWG